MIESQIQYKPIFTDRSEIDEIFGIQTAIGFIILFIIMFTKVFYIFKKS